MKNIIPKKRKTPKVGTDAHVSDDATPVPSPEPSFFPARPDTGPQPKLSWPPLAEDLKRLYLEQRLSASKIAKVYGLSTPNQRSAAFLVTYHLKKHGIERRDKSQELRRDTKKIVSDWQRRHPTAEERDTKSEEDAVIELLRTPNLSIKYLDPQTKQRVRAVIEELHLSRGISLTDIADLIGSKTSGYASWMTRQLGIKPRDFEEAQLKGIHQKVRKYKRRPFDGTDEDKAYLLGLKHGDLYAYNPFGDAVRVSTSTTHPALANLFTDLFSQYGHVSKHPRYKKDTGTYEWNIQAILDKSFEFLLEPRERCREWILKKESTMMAYLAGLIDAEGHIRPYANPRTVAITVTIYNTDVDLVGFAYECLKRLGSRPLRPYLDKEGGYVSTKGFRIPIRKDYWRVMVARFDEAQTLLRRLPLRHKEKVAVKEVVLSVAKGEVFERIADRIASLKKSVRNEVDLSTKDAESEFRRTHPEVNPRLDGK